MLRIIALTFAAALLTAPANAQVRDGLAVDLYQFVEAFELTEVPPAGQARLQMIVDHPSASHVAKLVAIHDVLEQHDALVHIDMHGAQSTLHSALSD